MLFAMLMEVIKNDSLSHFLFLTRNENLNHSVTPSNCQSSIPLLELCRSYRTAAGDSNSCTNFGMSKRNYLKILHVYCITVTHWEKLFCISTTTQRSSSLQV